MHTSLERVRKRGETRGSERGFTLIELLIVIVILGILAAMVVFGVQELSGATAQASCRSDFKTVEHATEVFKAGTGAYPGGSYTPGITVNTVPEPSGYVSPPAGAATQTGVRSLLGTATGNLGPWIKDAPVHAGHYEIAVSNDGKGTISIWSSDGKETIPVSSPTDTQADCSSVS